MDDGQAAGAPSAPEAAFPPGLDIPPGLDTPPEPGDLPPDSWQSLRDYAAAPRNLSAGGFISGGSLPGLESTPSQESTPAGESASANGSMFAGDSPPASGSTPIDSRAAGEESTLAPEFMFAPSPESVAGAAFSQSGESAPGTASSRPSASVPDEKEWPPPAPSRRRVRLSWGARIFGEPGPPKYSLKEIFLGVWRDYVLNPQSWIHLILFGAMTVLFFYMAVFYWVTTIDDAYITFRFSDNFIHGRGLVYNLGQRVEGYTNFTWMAAIGVCIGLGWDAMYCAKVMGFLCCLGAMWGVAYWGGRISRKRDPWIWLAVLPLAFNAHFAHWSMQGLETQLQVILILWAYARFYVEMRDARAWSLSPYLATLAAMTRFDSLYYLTPLAAYAVVQIARGRLDWRRFLRWGCSAAIAFGLYFLWKWSYFGDLFPNTYYAKLEGNTFRGRGVAHVRYFYFQHGMAFILLWAAPILLCILWPRPVTLLVLGPLILNAFYVYHVNGDWMQNFRFFQVALPFLSMALLLGIRRIQEWLPDWRRAADERERAGAPPLPLGNHGFLWLLAEIAIWGAWVWLFFFKGREIITDKANSPPNRLWWIAISVLAFALLLRWGMGLWAGWRRKNARRTMRISRGARISAPAPSRAKHIVHITIEAALFCALVFGFFRYYEAFRGIPQWLASDVKMGARDFLPQSPLASWTPPKLDWSARQWAAGAAALLAFGWLMRWISRGRLAKTLVRWPVYAALAFLLLLSARHQFGVGYLYIFHRDPLDIPREKNWADRSNIQRCASSGFSLALQSVGDWMMRNCVENSTIFMSDIGWPMWVCSDMGLIDVDGLVDRHLADAPSVRIHLKSRDQFARELRRQRGYKEPLTREQENMIRDEANRQHHNLLLERNRKYILREEPEYCNIFLSQQDPKSTGYAYPEISRAVYDSREFKERYTDIYQCVKTTSSFNHFFRRKDVADKPPRELVLKRLREALRRNPRMVFLYMDLIRFLRDSQGADGLKDPEIRRILQQGKKKFPHSIEFLNNMAQFARDCKDDKMAEELWLASIQAKPEQDWLYRHMADFYWGSGRLPQAIKIAEKGLQYTPHTGLHVHLAYMYEQAKQYDDAEKVLLAAGEMDKKLKNTRPFIDLGAMLVRANRPEKALSAYRKALELNPSLSDVKAAVKNLEDKLNTAAPKPEATQAPPAPAASPAPAAAPGAKPEAAREKSEIEKAGPANAAPSPVPASAPPPAQQSPAKTQPPSTSPVSTSPVSASPKPASAPALATKPPASSSTPSSTSPAPDAMAPLAAPRQTSLAP